MSLLPAMASKFGGSVRSSGGAESSSRPSSSSGKPEGLSALPASSEVSCALRPFHSFGVHGPMRDNIEWLSESRIIFPVGQHVATLLVEKKEMDFIDLHPTVNQVVALSIAPNRKRVAFCELAVPPPGHRKSKDGGSGWWQ